MGNNAIHLVFPEFPSESLTGMSGGVKTISLYKENTVWTTAVKRESRDTQQIRKCATDDDRMRPRNSLVTNRKE